MCIHPVATADMGTSSSHPAHSGFTLLELLLAIVLSGLLISAVFGVTDGATQLGKSMSTTRVSETRISNFVMEWRDFFENVPPGTALSCGVGRAARGTSGRLLITGSQMPFCWDSRLKHADAVEFGSVRAEGSKTFDLVVRHLKHPERARDPQELEVVAELPLLEKLTRMQWKFYDAGEKKWFADWDPKKRHAPPLFIRLHFAFQNDPRDHEYTFWIANDLQPQRTAANVPTAAPAP